MHATTEDDRLLNAWQSQRDPEAFRRLCERYAGLIEGVCRRQQSPDAPEAVQAVFLVLARRAGSVSGASLGAWLVSTAQRVVLNQHRSVARRSRHEQEAAVRKAQQSADIEPVWAEARDHLDDALASLSAGRREAILRFYLAGRPQAEVAAELGCSVDAVKTRVHEGLEGLRRFFTRKGIALGAVALASGLASEATASEPTLVATCVQTVLTPATAPGAAALAHGVTTAMFIKTATLAAAGMVLAGSCLTAALVVGAEAAAAPLAASTSQSGVETPQAQSVIITPRSTDASEVFAELERQGGPQVLRLREDLYRMHEPILTVPREFRFQPVASRKLIDAVARTQALRTAWVRGGTAVVLYVGVPDSDVEQVRMGLASADVVVRRDAAWRAGWLWDVRIVPLLVKAAKDPDSEVARRALEGLNRVNWDVVVLLDETAIEVLTTNVDKRKVASALGRVGGDVSLAWLETALADQDRVLRVMAVRALGRVRGDKALTLLEKAFSDQEARVRANVAVALGRVGGDKALACLEKALADQDGEVRGQAAEELGRVGGDKALVQFEKALGDQDDLDRITRTLDQVLAQLEKALGDQDVRVRCGVVKGLGHVGGAKALALLEKALVDQDSNVRKDAISALGEVGGDEALTLLEEALLDPDINVRDTAVYALGRQGGEQALVLLEKAFTNQWNRIRSTVAYQLCLVDQEKALALIEKGLANQDGNERAIASGALQYVGGEKTQALLEKALADQDAAIRRRAVTALSVMSGGSLPLFEKALADENATVRADVAFKLRNLGGDRALPLLEKALADQDAKVRCKAAEALGWVRGDKALTLLEKALADRDAKVRREATQALGSAGGDKALALLERALTNQDANIRGDAASALGRVRGDRVLGDKALALLEKALADEDTKVRCEAAQALWVWGYEALWGWGDKALTLLEKALADQDASVRASAAQAIFGENGRGLALLEKALADPDASVRSRASSGLGNVGGNKARDLLLGMLAGEKDQGVLNIVCFWLNQRFGGDPAVVKALKDFKQPGQPQSQPPPAPSQESAPTF